eukprot:350490-Rhodomonas_salina.1
MLSLEYARRSDAERASRAGHSDAGRASRAGRYAGLEGFASRDSDASAGRRPAHLKESVLSWAKELAVEVVSPVKVSGGHLGASVLGGDGEEQCSVDADEGEVGEEDEEE